MLGLSAREAIAQLQRGEVGFILRAAPEELAALNGFNPTALFYAGLLVQAAEAALPESERIRAPILFTHALESPNPRIQEAAARELLLPLLEAPGPLAARLLEKLRGKRARFNAAPSLEVLYAAALYTQGRFGELGDLYRDRAFPSPWGRALSLLASLRLGGSGAPLGAQAPGARLLSFFLDSPLEEPQHWAFGELEALSLPRSPIEMAAVSGRFAVSRRSYEEALRRFRPALNQMPELFLEHPELLSDLGRAFLYAGPAAREEGETRFRKWEEALTAGAGERRFRLAYYRGRFLRQDQRHAKAVECFARALPFAPDPLQEDACIWYLLSSAESADPATVPAFLKTYAPLWHSDRSFADIYDRLSRRLVVNRQWETFLELFPLLRGGTNGTVTAQYAYIIGRALQEGALPPLKAGAILEASGEKPFFDGNALDQGYRTQTALQFFRIAFEEAQGSFYYRALSAAQLGKNTEPIPPGSSGGSGAARPDHPEELEFLLGFFTYGAASYAFPSLQKMMGGLSIPDLRLLAAAFAGAGLWEESIRVSAAFMAREGYELSRRDMELAFPRPFAELIEESARKEALPPELLFGLIRTESAFRAAALSRVGAVGLTQLMPATAQDMARRIRGGGGPDYAEAGELDLRNPEVNVPLGARYLRYLWDRLGSPMLALTAYNGGMGRIPRWRAVAENLSADLFPETIEYPETRDYGRRVLAAAAAYGYLYYGMSMEAVLADIFNEPGAERREREE